MIRIFADMPRTAKMTVLAAMAVAPQILVLIGPTASGKSAVAMLLAQHLTGEILSVDSMQVYQDMNIGTAKPPPADRQRIIHHGIDLVRPSETFAVSQFVDLADEIIAASKTPLIATGGTPLYYKSLFEGLFEGPSADPSVRLRLSAEPLQELHHRLQKIDPAAALRIHVNDRRRLIRALEVFELTGQPISSMQTDWSSGKSRHAATWFGLKWEKESLNRRINSRVKQMIEAGWLDETRGLLNRYGQLSKTAAEATGYRELIDHLNGKISLDDAIEQIKIATRQLARRQMKWFRQFPNVHWLPGDAPPEALTSEIVRLSLAVSR
jgi:tRNA dimethylallyltransferase